MGDVDWGFWVVFVLGTIIGGVLGWWLRGFVESESRDDWSKTLREAETRRRRVGSISNDEWSWYEGERP